ncbi:MAG: chemotaxis protein CheX, partial [Desulfobacterota bacterium]|nr:chemotaxis protein CheX [Thermodesulfobacteriota bacterium]
MKSDYLDKMKKVACDVFEQLAFMFAEEIEIQDFEYNDGPLIHATMSFSGYRSGTIDITMPMPLASQFARNILGLDESIEIDSQHYEDAVRELLNTICGRMLTSLFGEAEVFDLHVPTTEY